MKIHGPDPLETDASSFAVGETIIWLLRKIRDDLRAAETDGEIHRSVLGHLVCLRVLLEGIPDYRFHSHPDDMKKFRDQYLAWFDAHAKRFRFTAKQKKSHREKALKEFEQVLAYSKSKTYPLGDR